MANLSTRAKWRSSMSARSSVEKKCLTRSGIVRDAILRQLTEGSILARPYRPTMNYSSANPKVVIPVFSPKEALLDGAKILDSVLLPKGFRFQFREEGRGAGGNFAWGELVREDRRLELHFRKSLGLVRYHVGDQSAFHESYMRELGLLIHCHGRQRP
jgi:hypothetical protein